MAIERPSEWPLLFDLATSILDHFEKANGYMPEWSFGDGTALMLQIDHRESHDIDLFLEDPQICPFSIPTRRASRSSESRTATITRDVRGLRGALETPAEIIAKKVYFRGWNFMPRDMFDLAAVVEHLGKDYARAAVQEWGAGGLSNSAQHR